MEIVRIGVELEGLADIMFDRFYDHSGEDRPPESKMYYDEDGNVVLPATAIYSFLFRDLPPVGAIRFVEKKKAKDFLAIAKGHVIVSPALIPFTDGKGKNIRNPKFDGKRFRIVEEGGITKMSGGKIIKQEARKRPVLRLPWNLRFNLSVVKNDLVTADKLERWFNDGGFAVALGTYRPQYGRFFVKEWNVLEEAAK